MKLHHSQHFDFKYQCLFKWANIRISEYLNILHITSIQFKKDVYL